METVNETELEEDFELEDKNWLKGFWRLISRILTHIFISKIYRFQAWFFIAYSRFQALLNAKYFYSTSTDINQYMWIELKEKIKKNCRQQ
jgi:hypothetical protein